MVYLAILNLNVCIRKTKYKKIIFMMKVLCILFARGLLVLCVCGLEHSMFTVPRDSVASFYTSAALQVWSRYPALFQSVYPTIPPATCALAS